MSRRQSAERQSQIAFDELQVLSSTLPGVRPEFLLDVFFMPRDELQRRVINQASWITAHASALDGIPEIRGIPGGLFDGCRDHRAIRRIVLHLVEALRRRDATNERQLLEILAALKALRPLYQVDGQTGSVIFVTPPCGPMEKRE